METTVESPMISAQSPLEQIQPTLKRIGHPITAENAAEYARKSAIARARQAQERKQLDKSKEIIAEAKALSDPASEDGYRLNRLRMTREALDTLYDDLGAAEDEKGKKAICDAIARLSEVERQLAGRPAPGSLRPAQAKTKRTTPESYGPVE